MASPTLLRWESFLEELEEFIRSSNRQQGHASVEYAYFQHRGSVCHEPAKGRGEKRGVACLSLYLATVGGGMSLFGIPMG